MKFLGGLILIALGVIIIRYRYQIHDFTGEWDWANKYLGGNGTVVAIVMIGALLISMGTIYPFGGLDGFGGPVLDPAELKTR